MLFLKIEGHFDKEVWLLRGFSVALQGLESGRKQRKIGQNGYTENGPLSHWQSSCTHLVEFLGALGYEGVHGLPPRLTVSSASSFT